MIGNIRRTGRAGRWTGEGDLDRPRCIAAARQAEMAIVAARHATQHADPIAVQYLEVTVACAEVVAAGDARQGERRSLGVTRDIDTIRQDEIAAVTVEQ